MNPFIVNFHGIGMPPRELEPGEAGVWIGIDRFEEMLDTIEAGKRGGDVAITFDDGTELTCEADDLRRVPSLVDTTDSWDFACDAGEFPEDSDSAALVVVDDYN